MKKSNLAKAKEIARKNKDRLTAQALALDAERKSQQAQVNRLKKACLKLVAEYDDVKAEGGVISHDDNYIFIKYNGGGTTVIATINFFWDTEHCTFRDKDFGDVIEQNAAATIAYTDKGVSTTDYNTSAIQFGERLAERMSEFF